MNEENLKGLSAALISIILGIISIISLIFKYIPELTGTAALIAGLISKAISKNKIIEAISTAGMTLGLIGALIALTFIFIDKSILDYVLPLFPANN